MCLKFLIFLGVNGRCWVRAYAWRKNEIGSTWGTLLQILILPVTRNIAKNRLHRVTYLPAELKDVMFKCIWKKIHYLTFDLSHWKYCPVPFTLCDLRTYKGFKWLRYEMSLQEKCIIWPLIFSRTHKMLSIPFKSCDLGICSLKLLRQTFKEVMHLQETWWTDVCTHKWGRWTDFDAKVIYIFFLKSHYNKIL